MVVVAKLESTMTRSMSLRPFSRRAKADDSIIRGAAIIRDHIKMLDVSHESSEGPEHPLVSRTSGSNSNRVPTSSSSFDEDTNFSDPWAKITPSRSSTDIMGRPVSPDEKKEDAATIGFDSVTAGETFASSGSPAEWAARALNNYYEEDDDDDISVNLSVRSSQPDTDPCPPVTPPRRPKSKSVGVAKVTTCNLVSPMASKDGGDEEDVNDSSTYDFVDRFYNAEDEFDMQDYDDVVGAKSYLPKEMRKPLGRSGVKRVQEKKKQAQMLQLVTSMSESESSKSPRRRKPIKCNVRKDVISPLSAQYNRLRQDPAYIHAEKAGHVWQSLVGCQIRFPSSWWNGARGPPLGLTGSHMWQFFGRYPSNNPNLRRYCKHRSAPGRLLLHIVVQDLVSWQPVQDIVVGCFDPNARGIRRTDQAQLGMQDYRELWLAVRKRSDSVSVIDSLLAQGRSWQDDESRSPLGPEERVTNSNVRAVFGEEPPVESIFVHESTLYERLVAGQPREVPPLFLVREFVFC